MINHTGYENLIKKIYDEEQQQVFDQWDNLQDDEKIKLLKQLSAVNFDLLKRLYTESSIKKSDPLKIYPVSFIPVPSSKEEILKYQEAEKTGEDYIKKGKTAAFLVAGGQGTRLGFDGPKGLVKVSPVKGKSLFQIFSEKILYYSKKYNIDIPFIIMTSTLNNDATVSFFKDNNYFGLKEKNVIFFSQNTIPSLSSEGKLILKDRCTIFTNPDGHGGSLSALKSSGVLKMLHERNIEILSFFQVDNPLVKIIDPLFIGLHLSNKCEVSNKAVAKTSPEEKVGVFCLNNDKNLSIVEYSALSDENRYKKDNDGRLSFSMGNIAIHLFNLSFIDKITESEASLPYHIAKKKIKAFVNNEIKEIDGIKFEKFIFDALPLSEKDIIMEVKREEEFAPVKNSSGEDSLESSKKIMSSLHKKWLEEKGYNIPDNSIVEISPLTAPSENELGTDLKVIGENEIYL